MSDVFINFVVYLISFIAIWVGAGLIISSVSKLSYRLKVPPFLISFLVLGIMTSTPEIAVGITAVSSNNPGIFVGNLLGGTAVLFLLVIPLLAIFGKGIKLSHQLSGESILLTLAVSLSPFFMVLDNQLTNPEGAALIALYLIVVYILQKNQISQSKSAQLLKMKKYSFLDIIKVLSGAIIVFISSNIIVNQTLYFAEEFHIAPFYISLIVLSIGTNLPEITLAIRSIITGKKDIAFGDYLGSAAANTFLFGAFTLVTKEPVLQVDNFMSMFLFVLVGFVLFFYFSRTKHTISPKEGAVLLLVYALFVLVEFI